MASEATIMTILWIMHMDTRVIRVVDFKFDVNSMRHRGAASKSETSIYGRWRPQ